MMTTSAMCWQAFLVLHLKAFRFSDSARRWRHPDALPNAPSERDLYYLMLERFARPSEVAFYVSAIVRRAMIAGNLGRILPRECQQESCGQGAVGVHLHRGWSKTVLKMDLRKEERAPVIALGQALIYPLCLGFCAVPCWVWAVQQPHVAAALGVQLVTMAGCQNATAP